MKHLFRTIAAAALVIWSASAAQAWQVHGRVICAGNNIPLAGATLTITSNAGVATVSTDIDGYYTADLDALFTPDSTPRSYVIVLNLSSLPADATITIPPGGSYSFATTVDDTEFERNFTVSSGQCTPSACWMTGGGQKIDPILNIPVAEKGTKENFGGNVYPGCSATAGDGGNWNHLSRALKLHFQGRSIQVLRCGNVPDIPPGSTSPATPFNFIEFQGTGRVSGIQGNKADYPLVYFFGRVEDRNEPGNDNALGPDDGSLIDRYFLRVFTNPADPAGSTLILSDIDSNSATVDPAPITHGNLQIHVTSCAQQ